MSKEINKIIWRCRRGMRELDLLFRSFSTDSLPNLGKDELLMLDEILNYDDQKLYDYIFKNESLNNLDHERFIQNYLKKFNKL
jgi:antitoxin CptB